MDLKERVIKISVVVGCLITITLIGFLAFFVVTDTLKPSPKNTVSKNLFIIRDSIDIAQISKVSNINDIKILYDFISESLKENEINNFVSPHQYKLFWKKLNFVYIEQFILIVDKYFEETEWKSNNLISKRIADIKNTGFIEYNTPIWDKLEKFQESISCYNQMRNCLRIIKSITNNIKIYIPVDEISNLKNEKQRLINIECLKNKKLQQNLLSSFDYLESEAKANEILNATPTSLEFDASGGNNTITINTNLSLWSNSAVYSWLKISKGMSSLTVTCDKNLTTDERSDNFEIKGLEKTAKIYIKQKASIIPASGIIDNIWVYQNEYKNYQKGIKIYTNFTVNNMKGTRCSCNAYFYLQNGNKLKDFNNSYNSTDGQVSVGDSFTPSFDKYSCKIILFIPYSELHLTKGSYNLKLNIELFDQNSKQITTSDYVNFKANLY